MTKLTLSRMIVLAAFAAVGLATPAFAMTYKHNSAERHWRKSLQNPSIR